MAGFTTQQLSFITEKIIETKSPKKHKDLSGLFNYRRGIIPVHNSYLVEKKFPNALKWSLMCEMVSNVEP